MENQTQQTPAQEVPSKSPKLPIIFMAIFVILSLSAVAFLWYQNQQLKKMILSYQQEIQPSPTLVAMQNPTSDWKTYINEKYRFSFQYPTDWNVNENSISDTSSKITNDKMAHQIEIHDENSKIMALISPELPISYGAPFTKTDTVIASKNVTLYTYGSGPTKHFSNFKLINFPNFVIDIYYGDDKKLGQILSTFKFLDSSPTPISKACTMEAKICPDGSSVGRTGPNCEFATCPTP